MFPELSFLCLNLRSKRVCNVYHLLQYAAYFQNDIISPTWDSIYVNKYKIKISAYLSKKNIYHISSKTWYKPILFWCQLSVKKSWEFPMTPEKYVVFCIKAKMIPLLEKNLFRPLFGLLFSAFYSSRWPIKSFLLWRSKNKTQSSNIVSVFCRISINIMHKILFFLSVC